MVARIALGNAHEAYRGDEHPQEMRRPKGLGPRALRLPLGRAVEHDVYGLHTRANDRGDVGRRELLAVYPGAIIPSLHARDWSLAQRDPSSAPLHGEE